MARLCERPGCSQPADVTYGIDAEHLVVWIESLDGAVVNRSGVLCRRHADAMVVPLGWMLDDRREPVPRLFKTRDAPTSGPAPTPKPRRHRTPANRDDTGQLTLSTMESPPPSISASPNSSAAVAARVVEDPPPASGVTVPDTPSEPWKPVFDHRDDLDGLLTASSPLLSRAFGKRDRPDDT